MRRYRRRSARGDVRVHLAAELAGRLRLRTVTVRHDDDGDPAGRGTEVGSGRGQHSRHRDGGRRLAGERLVVAGSERAEAVTQDVRTAPEDRGRELALGAAVRGPRIRRAPDHGRPGQELSHHAFGSAVDINVHAGRQDARLVAIFQQAGMKWGAEFLKI